MTREEFKRLSEVDQRATISKKGEILINLRQGIKRVTVYRLGNLLIKVINVNDRSESEVINEADFSSLFQSS